MERYIPCPFDTGSELCDVTCPLFLKAKWTLDSLDMPDQLRETFYIKSQFRKRSDPNYWEITLGAIIANIALGNSTSNCLNMKEFRPLI